jgi:ubiquinone/menaquinone biosynthesis C-methylase UbiE
LDNNLTNKELETLKSFFNDAIQKNKLKKTKDVQYNKDNRSIINIPSLFFNTVNRSFTLRNTEKRVSTLKSMTPKRVSNKNKVVIGKIEI